MDIDVRRVEIAILGKDFDLGHHGSFIVNVSKHNFPPSYSIVG
jgi:hypothetical protein